MWRRGGDLFYSTGQHGQLHQPRLMRKKCGEGFEGGKGEGKREKKEGRERERKEEKIKRKDEVE